MNPIELMGVIESSRMMIDSENGEEYMDIDMGDWQSLRTAIEAQAEELAQVKDEVGNGVAWYNAYQRVDHWLMDRLGSAFVTGRNKPEENTISSIEKLMEQSRFASHFAALMEGLEIPDTSFWMRRPPEALKEVGKAIAKQAGEVKEMEVELAQARARIGRLEGVLEHLSNPDNYSNPEFEADTLALAAISESPAQSLAAVRAEALREFSRNMQETANELAEGGNLNGSDEAMLVADECESEAERIEREAKEES